MWFFRQFPLAWRVLADRPARFALSIVGVAFAVVVMFTELGFLNGVTDSSINVSTLLASDLVVAHPRQEQLKSYVKFSGDYLREIQTVPGVEAAIPMYIAAPNWSNPQDGSRNRVLLLGVNVNDPQLNLPAIAKFRKELNETDTLIFDRRARIELGKVDVGTVSRVAGRRGWWGSLNSGRTLPMRGISS